MMTSPQGVFVGFSAVPADLMSATSADMKKIFLEDASGAPIALGSATTEQPFRVCQVEGIDSVDGMDIARIRRSPLIDPVKVRNAEFLANATVADLSAPVVNEEITIDLTNVVVDPAARYVLRLQFRDLTFYNAGPAFYTHSYEVFGDTVADATGLADAFRAQIKSKDDARVTVNAEGSPVLVLTAKDKDNTNGTFPYNMWSQVNMVASIYYTTLKDSVLYNNYYEAVPGADVEITANHDMGKGYWKQARDAERLALGYRGYLSQTNFPTPRPTMMVEEGAEYNVLTIDFESAYRSADNQYMKTNPITVTIFDDKAQGATANLLKDIQTLLGF